MVYNKPNFKVICKKIIVFETIYEINSWNFTSFYVQGQPRLRIRIRDHSWTYFNVINSMAVSKLENELLLKITFFKVSYVVSICIKFQYFNIWGSVWKLSIPLHSCWWVGFNFKFKSMFWLTGKNLTFWTILLLGSEMWNWSLEVVMNARRA